MHASGSRIKDHRYMHHTYIHASYTYLSRSRIIDICINTYNTCIINTGVIDTCIVDTCIIDTCIMDTCISVSCSMLHPTQRFTIPSIHPLLTHAATMRHSSQTAFLEEGEEESSKNKTFLKCFCTPNFGTEFTN